MFVKKTYLLVVLIALASVSNSCVEEFEFGTQNFEDILVVQARLTDELKNQEVILSRSFRLENEGPVPEVGATVSIIDDQQMTYQFTEVAEGQYISNDMFAAMTDRNYQLMITSQDGQSYTSRSVSLPQKVQIDDLYAERVINDDGVEGIGIFVDSFDATGNASFYRYEYEETYQILPPFWFDLDIEVISEEPPEIAVVSRTREERVCYKTDLSKNILLTTTNNLAESRVEKFMVNFVTPDEEILRGRYSILVKQFVQSLEAHEFYETLRDFSDSESLFSQIQPGFINGNVLSVDNPNENVLGYFEVTSVSVKRIFVNREDLFPNSIRPEFSANCPFFFVSGSDPRAVIDAVTRRGLKLVAVQGALDFDTYTFTFRICSDCNVLGSNIRPDFWVD